MSRIGYRGEGELNGIAGYNSRVHRMCQLHLRPFCRLRVLIILLSSSLPTSATEWNGPAREVAEKIAASVGKVPITLSVSDRASLQQDEVEAIRSALQRELIAAGLNLADPKQSGVAVDVTISENLGNYIWVAKIHKDASPQVILMIAVARSEPARVIREPVTMIVRKVQLWSQPEQILDVGVIDSSPPRIIVLDGSRVAIYGLQGTSWHEDHIFAIKHSSPWPRDLRGRVILRKDHLFDAYLPGVSCSSTTGEPISLECRESDDPWPLEIDNLTAFFSPTRNFFTGVLVPGIGANKSVPPFYTAAMIQSPGGANWVFAGVDGQVRMTTQSGLKMMAAPDWGSDIANVTSACLTGSQILATSKNDAFSSDSVRAFEVDDRHAVPVSREIDLDGTVTALWTDSDANNAVVVVRSLSTGSYEAFRLAVSCGQ